VKTRATLFSAWILAVPLGLTGAQEVLPDMPSAAEAVPLWTPAEREAIQVLRSLRKKTRPSDEELAVLLGAPGESLLPLYWDVLVQREVPALEEGAPQVLSEVQQHALTLGLMQFDRELVLAHVGNALAAETDLRRRHAGLVCLAAVGRANDYPQAFELALGAGEEVPPARLATAFRQSVAQIAARDPRAFEQLVSLRRLAPAPLLIELVRAMGESENPRALLFLSEVAYWHEDLLQEVLSQVSALGPSGDEAIDSGMRVRVRGHLDPEQSGLCRAALTALAALQDREAIGAIIPLLASEKDGLKQNAHWALRELTSLRLAPEPEVWSRWHQAELYWMIREKPREFQRLNLAEPREVADALREILGHPLAREELAAAVPELLKSPWPALRTLACNTLADLRSKAAVERLVWALEDPDAGVMRAAHAALRRLTGFDLPLDPVAWQEATESGPLAHES
jgi:hypothetical protein